MPIKSETGSLKQKSTKEVTGILKPPSSDEINIQQLQDPEPMRFEDEGEVDESDEDFLEELHGSGAGINFPRESFMEMPYNFDPTSTSAVYYVGSNGDIINEGLISDPEVSIRSCSSSEGFTARQEFDGEGHWETEEDEEDPEIRRFSDYFGDEQTLTDVECDEIREGLEYLTRTSGGDGGFQFKNLDMSDHQLEDLSSVEHFTSLKSLNISRNFLRTVRELGSMSQLVRLDASRNELEDFLDIYSELSLPLREANFSRNKISAIIDLKQFWALTTVNLSYNKLTVVDEFQNCIYLRVLNLSHNNITEINNLSCPNLVILLLKYNELTTMEGIEDCTNLRYLSISNNRISELHSLRALPELMELRCQENQIEDLLELEHLKPLIYLSHLCLQPNPCMDVGMSRLLLVHMLPQVRYMDGEQVTPDEILEARNTFNPSFTKLAFEDHTNSMLEKACQSSNTVFDEFCRVHPIPPIILLVGSSRSNCDRLAMQLKEKLGREVLVGGVHSTATTIEGGKCDVDIPVSFEGFLEMKNRGEFLATSHILGRLCGFATSQIARAAERGSILVATVPLVTAICIRKWRFNPKYILILPSDPPQFNVDQFLRSQSVRKIENELSHGLDDDDDASISPMRSRLVSFATYALPHEHHTVESSTNFLSRSAILKNSFISDGSDDTEQGFVLIKPKQTTETVPEKTSSGTFDIEEELFSIEGEVSSLEVEEHPESEPEVEEEEVVDEEREAEEEELVSETQSGEVHSAKVLSFKNSEGLLDVEPFGRNYGEPYEEYYGEGDETVVEADFDNHPIYSHHPLHMMQETPQFTVTNRLRRLRRLASILLIQAGEAEPSDLEYVPDIMMNLPGVQPIGSDVMEAIDWKKTILQNSFYNSILETDEAYYMVLTQTTTTDGKPEPRETLRGTLMPHRTPFGLEQSSSATNHQPVYSNEPSINSATTGDTKLKNHELTIVKDERKQPEAVELGRSTSSIKSLSSFASSSFPIPKKAEFSSVAFSEQNLLELASSTNITAAASEKIRGRKKTGFVPLSKGGAPPVAFSEVNLKHLLTEKERARLSQISDAPSVSDKINSRKQTVFAKRVLTPDDSDSSGTAGGDANGVDDVNDDVDELVVQETDQAIIVNQFMNFEEETTTLDDVQSEYSDDDESEDLIKDGSAPDVTAPTSPQSSDKSLRFKHRNAIEQSILRTREEYHNYHLENPGFFSSVLDTADLEKSGNELVSIAIEMIANYKSELKNLGQFMKTHAGVNAVDEEAFIRERAGFLQWCTHEWNKGYNHPLQHMKDKYGVDKESRTFFERKRCPDNILDPTLPRHHSSAKVRQLIRVAQHQNAKFTKKPKSMNGGMAIPELSGCEEEEFSFEEDLESFLAGHEDEFEGEIADENDGEFYGEGIEGRSSERFHDEEEYAGESNEE